MRACVRHRLEELRADYAQTIGQPFAHFYCPMLFKDEDVPLCQAHIINCALPDTPRDWTVQRSDVDNFYGSRFEADFIAILYNENRSPARVLTDKTLSKRFRPRILVDAEPVDYYVATGDVPDHFTPIEYSHDGQSVELGLKIPPQDFVAEAELEVEIAKDVRMPALVSLVKAAHLTLFDMLGYRYALSAGGRFVGWEILGKFFYQNDDKPSAEAFENAHSFFHEFQHMVRPVQSLNLDLRGTVTDNKLVVCRGPGRSPWALIVFIRTSRSMHAVMIPVFDQPDAVATFLGFLNNRNESVKGSLACLEEG